jgi:hypothetical protein
MPAAAISDDNAESSLATRPFESRPKALPPKYEYAESRELFAFFASFGVVWLASVSDFYTQRDFRPQKHCLLTCTRPQT